MRVCSPACGERAPEQRALASGASSCVHGLGEGVSIKVYLAYITGSSNQCPQFVVLVHVYLRLRLPWNGTIVFTTARRRGTYDSAD